MTQRHTAQAIGTRSLVWLLLLAVVLLGLSVTRQQALGALHQHTDTALRSGSGSTFGVPSFAASNRTTAASGLAQDWLSRWRQQQVFGHGQIRVGLAASPTLWAPNARPDDHHTSLDRHHHALGDDSVVALDGAAEAADAASVGTILLLPQFASPSQGLALAAMAAAAARNGPWPVQGAVRFASRKVAPLLRPPAA